MRIFALALLISIVAETQASSCGESAIPFSFEALENGQPVLGCARPTCFGWTADAKPVSSNAQFYRVNGVPDGFIRKSSEIPPKRLGEDRYNFQQQTAYCDSSFEKTSCGFEGQWVGGIGPVSNTSTQQLSLQCCSYEGLRHSTDRGVAVVKPGQIVIGGEVTKKGRQYAFDYISDISLRRGPDGSISYDVSVRRFPCVPIPSEQSSRADSEVHSEIIKKFDHSSLPSGNHIAFQAPIRQVGEGALQQIGVQETIERVVETPVRPQTVQGPYQIVEEVQQQVQPQVQPQPQTYVYQAQLQPQAVAQPQPQYYYYQPQPQPQYYQPAAQPSAPYYGSGAGQFWCFSADTVVHTVEGKDVRMDELKVDDWILAKQGASLAYLPVKSWLHRLPKQKAEFQKLDLEDGTSLKLTDLHYIYRTTCENVGERVDFMSISDKAVRAEEIKAGDCVYQAKGEQGKEYLIKARVVKNTVVNDTGIFAPLTPSGDIIVNGIHASCHAVLHSNAMQSTFFGYVDYFKGLGKWLFYSDDSEVKDIPLCTEMFANMMDLVLPKDLHTF